MTRSHRSGWAPLIVIAALGCATPRGPHETVPPSSATPEAAAGAAFMTGRLFELEGRLLEAVEAYETAVRLDPESADLHRMLARVRGRLGQSPLAVEHAERAFELDPQDELNRRTLAGLYIVTKRYVEAADLLEPMFQSDALSPEGLLVLLRLQVELGRVEGAREVTSRVLERARGEGGGAPPLRAFIALGRAYERLGEWTEAEAPCSPPAASVSSIQ